MDFLMTFFSCVRHEAFVFRQQRLRLSLANELLERICCHMSAKCMYGKGSSAAMEVHRSREAFEDSSSNTRLRQVRQANQQ